MENSEIAWTDNTFNPWIGCTKVSDGCKNCYAEALMDKRMGKAKWGPQGVRVKTGADYWKQPIRWNRKAEREGKRVKVFCASLADLFEDNGQVENWRMDLFELIDDTPALDWLLLTKRPENVMQMVPYSWIVVGFPENVWMGTTVEDQKAADTRIEELELIPARIRFLSCEPLLGPIDFHGNIPFNWCIVGGESGANCRPMKAEWAISIKKQCDAAYVPFFMKQLSQTVDGFRDFDRFTPELRVRQFPEVIA